jgi:hypothetical protein
VGKKHTSHAEDVENTPSMYKKENAQHVDLANQVK